MDFTELATREIRVLRSTFIKFLELEKDLGDIEFGCSY